jgi:hypothetical protein
VGDSKIVIVVPLVRGWVVYDFQATRGRGRLLIMQQLQHEGSDPSLTQI